MRVEPRWLGQGRGGASRRRCIGPALCLLLSLGCGPAEPARVPQAPATSLSRGVNLLFWLSHPLPPGALSEFGFQAGTDDEAGRREFFDEAALKALAGSGLDHVRVHVDWEPFFADGDHGGAIVESGFTRLDALIEWGERHEVGIVVTAWRLPGHDFMEPLNPIFEDETRQAAAERLWRAMAQRYAGVGGELWFDLLNEPRTPRPADWNGLARRLLAAVRAEDEDRIVAIEGTWPTDAGSLWQLERFDDPFVIYSFHAYAPARFTFQGLPWLGEASSLDLSAEVSYSKRVAREAARSVTKAASFARERGVPVWCGEFGASAHARTEDRNAYYRHMIEQLESHGIPWTTMDYRGPFTVAGPGGLHLRGVLEALQPR